MRSLQDKKISVIIPAFNEVCHIKENIEETIRTFDDFKCYYEIIVVDDGSKDGTYPKIKELAGKFNNGEVLVKRNFENFGKGRALKKGVRSANGEYIIFLDADMDLHPGQIATFFDIMELTEADIVIGSKMHPNSQLEYPWYRKLMSTVYYRVVKMMFGLPVRDTQTGLKLFKAEVLQEVMPKIVIKKFAFDMEILALACRSGYKIEEAPIILNSQRVFGRIGIWAIWKTLLDTLAIFYRMYIIKYYDKIELDLDTKPKRNGLRKKKRMRQRIAGMIRLQLW
ncbi:MAG: glycosyltransferase [PVC group bacterium]|nr:glycosyltransferase [PVC group bacterium]